MKAPVEKIMGLIDRLSEEERSMIANAYYQKPEKELSPKVMKLKKVFEKLDSEEQNDFIKLCGARMIEEPTYKEEAPEEGVDGVGIVVATSEEEAPEGEDLSDK